MSEAVLGPKSAKYRVFCGYTWKTPVYLENTWVSCRFPQFCPRFCPRPALRLRETREFPEGNSRETEWSTKHPLVSLEISGNEKCWGPSGFLFGFRKHVYRPTEAPGKYCAIASCCALRTTTVCLNPRPLKPVYLFSAKVVRGRNDNDSGGATSPIPFTA